MAVHLTLTAHVQGQVDRVVVAPGDQISADQELVIIESMKMEHAVTAPAAGTVGEVLVAPGAQVSVGDAVIVVVEAAVADPATAAGASTDTTATPSDQEEPERPTLAEVRARHAAGLDAQRPEAVAKRHALNRRTTRENLADLCDPGTFVEFGPLAIAAQRRRRPVDELIHATPADGLVGGVGTVNAARVGAERARCVLVSYDYTVLAGTQGAQNHRKKDRLFELAATDRLPIVLFAEGGGGRPGDTDAAGVSGLDCLAFTLFAQLSGLVPLVGVVAGRCFAGNAALAGCCDVIIATPDTNLGMAGPAMIEGGGLGVVRPEEIGPREVQLANGVIDLAADDDAHAVELARRYLSYFQGPLRSWEAPEQALLREVVPENRVRVYDIRRAIELLADTGSVLELRRGFGPGMVTALLRVEGSPLGVVANDPTHLGGAIDSDGADKAARFLQLCDAFGLPVLYLCDTPGIMVGPEAERSGTVRHASRLFVTGANLRVPFGTIILRKGYGLGAQAMAGGSFKSPRFCVSWPTGEFGGMGLEGAVRLGYRRELEAAADGEREALFAEMVERMYQIGKAVNVASHFEIDDTIDPADSRRWITSLLLGARDADPVPGKRRPNLDTW